MSAMVPICLLEADHPVPTESDCWEMRIDNADYANPLRLPDADVAAQFQVFPPNSLRIEAGNFAD